MGEGESPPIPPQAAGVVQVEVVNLLAQGRKHVGVLGEIVEERRAPAALRADDQRGRQAAERPGQAAIPRTQLAHRGLDDLEGTGAGSAHGWPAFPTGARLSASGAVFLAPASRRRRTSASISRQAQVP